MKFLKGASFWVLLGLAVLAGMNYLVGADFAAHFAPVVLGVFGALALIAGIRAASRARKLNKAVQAAGVQLANSKDQQTRWANHVKKQVAQVKDFCDQSCEAARENPLFEPEYSADVLLAEILDPIDWSARVQERFARTMNRMEENDG